MNDLSRKLGERIRTLRKARGFSQESLALKAGLATSFLGEIERSGKKPTVDSVEKIAKALDISLAELFAEGFDRQKYAADTTVLDKIVFLVQDYPVEVQEQLYLLIKQSLKLKDTGGG